MSLRKALVCYVTAAAVLALALCAITSNLCDFLVKEIYEAYPETVEKYYLTNERGERLGDGSYVGSWDNNSTMSNSFFVRRISSFPQNNWRLAKSIARFPTNLSRVSALCRPVSSQEMAIRP